LEPSERRIMQRKADKLSFISQGSASPKDIREGESIKRFVNGDLVEYTKYKGQMYTKTFDRHEKFTNNSRKGLRSIAAPNYDSGWVYISTGSGSNGNNYDFSHGLGSKFIMMQAYIKGDSSNTDEIFSVSNAFTAINDDNSTLSMLTFYMKDNNTVNVGTGNQYVFSVDNTDASTGQSFTAWEDGYLRLFCWRF